MLSDFFVYQRNVSLLNCGQIASRSFKKGILFADVAKTTWRVISESLSLMPLTRHYLSRLKIHLSHATMQTSVDMTKRRHTIEKR